MSEPVKINNLVFQYSKPGEVRVILNYVKQAKKNAQNAQKKKGRRGQCECSARTLDVSTKHEVLMDE